ncbi:MAG: PLP-dependent transferase, partial [Bdellovibrionales bacterium]|nr:PLP-dependent transferase [Bdellovibrionales bacterium]
NFWLGRYGFKVNFTDFSNPDSFLEFVTDKTRVIYLESPANPTLQLIDIEAVMSRVKQINSNRSEDRQIITVIDNTFATPFCQRPGEFGVDVIVHSLTKGISGFGTEMGGAVVADRKFLDSLILYRKDFGGNLSPSTAWHILVYGISTMPLRIQKSQSNAMKVAEYLEQHPKVENVRYPGLESFPQYEIATRMLKDFDGNFAPGIIIYFTLKSDSLEGSKSDGEKMMNFIADNSYCITLAVSLGQLRTLIEHPGSMTHAAYSAEEQMKIGMHPGGVRLAVGIESADDIIKDLDAALSQL